MIEFPELLDKMLYNFAEQNKLVLKKETHYEAINRELIWFEKNICKRLDFTVVINESDNQKFIDVTYLESIYPSLFPRLSRWLEKNIPYFPSFAKHGKWEKIDKFSIDLQEGLEKRINSYFQKVIQ